MKPTLYKIERYLDINHMVWMYAIKRPELQPDGSFKMTVQRDADGFFEDGFADQECAERAANANNK